MLLMAILFFALAALLGLYLLAFILQNKETPKAIVFNHGTLAAIGLIILIVYAIISGAFHVIGNIILFLIVAVIGGIVVFRDIIGKSIPKWLILLHGGLAIISFIILLFLLFYK